MSLPMVTLVLLGAMKNLISTGMCLVVYREFKHHRDSSPGARRDDHGGIQ